MGDLVNARSGMSAKRRMRTFLLVVMVAIAASLAAGAVIATSNQPLANVQSAVAAAAAVRATTTSAIAPDAAVLTTARHANFHNLSLAGALAAAANFASGSGDTSCGP